MQTKHTCFWTRIVSHRTAKMARNIVCIVVPLL